MCWDVISKISLGEALGFLEGRDVFDLIKGTNLFSWYVPLVSHIPWLHKVLLDNPIMSRLIPDHLGNFADKLIRSRLAPASSKNIGGNDVADERPDFLSHFIKTHKQQPDVMPLANVSMAVIGSMLAGTTGPSATLKIVSEYLAIYPASQTKLYDELSRARSRSPSKIAYAALKDLPYLDGVVREALRLAPHTLLRQERVAPARGLTLPDGTYLPAGTKVGTLGHVMTLVREVFGADADEYVPERWMRRNDESEKNFDERKRRMRTTEMTFGQGSRACMGKHIAMVEVTKAVAGLVLAFTFEPVESARGKEAIVRIYRRGASA